jgi:fimbrial isopeptide formation D2 family protein/uncharacterized repeat protein (TIGR01451 family)
LREELEMNKKILGILVCTLLISTSLTLIPTTVADWDPDDGHKMHWPQLPDPNGWDVYCTAGLDDPSYPWVCLADDWQCPESGWIEDIHFWGSWQYDWVGTIDHFVMGIAENIPPDDIIPWSRPGETLIEWEIYDYILRGPYDGYQGWYWCYLPDNNWWPNDHFLYWQYNVFLDEEDWFWQEEGKIYWLFISAIVIPDDPQPLWGWKSTYEDLHFMDDAVWAYWGELNWMPLTYPSGATMDLAFVVTGETAEPEPCVDIEKKVKDANGNWVEEIDANVCTEVEFKIEVQNCGTVDLTNLKIVDTLPSCLEYVANSATVDGTPQEPDISGNKLTWTIPGPLAPGSTATIKFKVHVISTGENVNHVKVTADSIGGTVTASDTATVNGIEAPAIGVTKKVSIDGGVTYSKEVTASVCTTVRFKITVQNTGNVPLTNIKIVDTLPNCLDYKDNATPNEPVISGNILTWAFPGPLNPGNSITIEFDAHVKTEGENKNEVTVTADDPTGGTVTDSDYATVHATPANNPPLKPDMPYKKAKAKPFIATKTITLCTKTTDPDGDNVYYLWNFGDGTTSAWSSAYASGGEACTTHDYEPGTYTVKVKAKDVHDAESEWSDPYTLRVSKSKISNNILINLLINILRILNCRQPIILFMFT